MPKKSTKSKSKRMTLRQKYKVLRKVKQHQKKKRREERKLGNKKREPKDPGIPSQWPFKEELLKELAWKKAQILADEKRKKEEKKAARALRKSEANDVEMDGEEGEEGQLTQLARLQAQASRQAADFDSRKRARLTAEFSTDKDNSRKAFYREFKKVVELSDVVIQVLDARDPLSCRCPDVETYIRTVNPNKKIILLLNKMDLVPREVGERWLRYFREELPCVAFKCSTQAQASNLGQKKMPGAKSLEEGLQGSACLGADTLLQLLKNYTRNAGIKTSITVGVVGLPNVGKSSLINSLKRARVAQVGNTPGVTKAVQEVHLDKHIKLLDSPGVVFADSGSEAAAALRNAIKVEKLTDPIAPVSEILKRVPPKQLMALYKVAAFSDAEGFLQLIALARGKLRKGGTPNTTAAAKIVLQDWNDGRIPYYTLPPSRGNTEFESAAIVTQWAKEFNADEVFANESSAVIAKLPSLNDDEEEGRAAAPAAGPRFIEAQPAGSAPRWDVQAMEAEDKEEEAGPSDMEDDTAPPASIAGTGILERGKAASKLLYAEEGQFNPHAARALKKKQKKADKLDEEFGLPGRKEEAVAKKAGAAAAAKKDADDDEEGSDFDFDDDNAMDEEGEEGSGDEEEGSGDEEEGSGDEEDDDEDEDGMEESD